MLGAGWRVRGCCLLCVCAFNPALLESGRVTIQFLVSCIAPVTGGTSV